MFLSISLIISIVSPRSYVPTTGLLPVSESKPRGGLIPSGGSIRFALFRFGQGAFSLGPSSAEESRVFASIFLHILAGVFFVFVLNPLEEISRVLFLFAGSTRLSVQPYFLGSAQQFRSP